MVVVKGGVIEKGVEGGLLNVSYADKADIAPSRLFTEKVDSLYYQA